jgi:hypothetical protein
LPAFPIGAIGPFEARAPLGHRERHAGVKLSTLAWSTNLPEQYRRKPTWRHVSTEIAKAAEGEKDLLMLRLSIFSACSPAGDKNNETCPSPYTTSR